MLKALRYAAANLLALAGNLFPKAALRPVEERVIHINAIFLKKDSWTGEIQELQKSNSNFCIGKLVRTRVNPKFVHT